MRKAQLRTSRLYTLIALLASLLFLVSDHQFLGAQFQQVLWIRVAVTSVAMLMLYSLKYASLKQAFMALAAGLILYNLAIVYVGVLAANEGLYAYQQGTILIIIYCCTLFQAPLRYTAVISFTCWTTYLIGIVVFTHTDRLVLLNNLLVSGMAVLMGLLAVQHRERYLVAYFVKSMELNEQKQQASKQALTDALTQLPNRYALLRHLESFQGEVPEDMLIMMLDVDNFKQLNDRHGHHSGDLALQLVADRLQELAVEEQAFLARYGGEEFIIFLPGVSSAKAGKTARRSLESVANIRHSDIPPLTISIGAYITRSDDTSIGECIEKADQALLKAKETGKNRTVFYADNLTRPQ
ncbi:hypothetical protein BTA51_23660 [Hahella sp. CCB-MM4]|uniref:GGDEF domain-containing protein n=1 Tax=Hahella sp. (strain CCB-MM4) TaxID=1926491 RepID=UPI000B9B1278|nr:GGDEF domain-containing protein [Hahella sp. CCB-MM4]OZG70839.1 hypothetical protein BTA51_23660 [Hahella sp. CCB-MM4]